MFRNILSLILMLLAINYSPVAAAEARPNIVWIVVEDMSPDFSCYGGTGVETPNVDQLAAEGVKFTSAVVTAPVCSACRSALMTGMYQTSIEVHNHRSGRGKVKIPLPDNVTPVPQLFGDAGYSSTNLSFKDFVRSAEQVEKNPKVSLTKTDYNFVWEESMYDDVHWSVRKSGQPFFCQIQLHGGKYRGTGDEKKWPTRVIKTLGSRTKPSDVKLPPYLPDHPVIREDWAQYLDTVRYTDWEVGKIIDRLREAGELNRTYIFFITDHGISHVRNKQFCYDGGTRIPLIVRGPSIKAAEVRDDPVEHIDLVASSLSLAGIERPSWMQSRDILAGDYILRRYAVSARDRCDETVDRIRSLRSPNWKYIRNFYPARPYLSPNRYKDHKPVIRTMRQLYAAGKLNAAQSKIMAEQRPPEELYDLTNDPYELTNLADQPAQQGRLLEMRQELQNWIVWSGDRGQTPESEAQYDSDMALYVQKLLKRLPKQAVELQQNVQLMKRWAAEGK